MSGGGQRVVSTTPHAGFRHNEDKGEVPVVAYRVRAHASSSGGLVPTQVRILPSPHMFCSMDIPPVDDGHEESSVMVDVDHG